MERMTLIKIAKKGPINSWFNQFINIRFVSYVDESGSEFKLRFNNGDELWIGKEFVEVKLHESTSWVSGSKFIYNDTPNPIVAEAKPTNVLLESMEETFNKCCCKNIRQKRWR